MGNGSKARLAALAASRVADQRMGQLAADQWLGCAGMGD
jgi:hypothetical protein